MIRRRFLSWLPFSALVGLVALTGCGNPSRAVFKATDVTGAPWGRQLHLIDHTGKPSSLPDFKGKVIVVFFGYTQCPDVCPTTLAALREVREKLGADGARLQVLFVTLDPDRDTQQVLSQYVPAFHPDFLGLYGDAEATAQAAKEFKVFFSKNPGTKPSSYTIDHSAGVFIFDPQGRLRLFGTQGYSVDSYLHDIRMLLAEG
ncbi:MAG: SCO family protein [Betaproteobacteria bacterium]